MTEETGPARENQEELQHYVAYACGRCEAEFIGRGSQEAKYCSHCGALLTAAAKQKPDAEPPAQRKKVLVVEDSQVLRNAFGKMVSSLGHEVLEASDGKEALRVAQDQHPDLIITDLHMPRMNGMELIEHLQRDGALKEVPIVILTSETNAASIAKGLGHGVVDYIVKDIGRVKEIRERLKQYL